MKRQDGSMIGEKGVQYGLQKKLLPAPVRRSALPQAPRAVNVFGDDDSDEDMETQVARQAEKKRTAAKVQQTYEDALAQDPSVFDYDEVYDSIQASRTIPKQQEKIERKSRYIAQLKEQADHRKREEDVRFERRLLKERQREDHLFEGKDKFVTSAYRKKLEEDKKWVEQQQHKEAEEEANDVRKVGHMGNFYSNLLTKNVALGTAAALPKPKEETAAVQRKSKKEQEEEEERQMASAAAALQQKQLQPRGPALDKYEQARRDAELVLRQQQGAEAGQSRGESDTTAVPSTSGQQDQELRGAAAPSTSAQAPRGPAEVFARDPRTTEQEEEGSAVGGAAGTAAAAAVAVGGKRRNDDASVMGAKERYLARKKQLMGQ